MKAAAVILRWIIAAGIVVGTAWLGDAMAQETRTYGLHIASAHSKPGFQDRNPGAYVRFSSGLTLGGYRNSDSGQSLYATWLFASDKHPFALSAGVVLGYRRGVVLGVVPSMRVDLSERTAARVSFVPKFEKNGAAALHIALEVRP